MTAGQMLIRVWSSAGCPSDLKAEGQSRACPHPAVPRRCDASPDDVPAQRGAAMESLEKAPLAVIMVNWRSAEDTIECLESLMHSQQPMRLIVCDNQSG